MAGDGRGEGAVEDELLDEEGRLEEGELFLRGDGKLLVEVAEKTGFPLRVGEVADGPSALRVGLAPKLDEGARGVARGAGEPEGIVPAVEDLGHGGSRPVSVKTCSRYSRSVSCGWVRK